MIDRGSKSELQPYPPTKVSASSAAISREDPPGRHPPFCAKEAEFDRLGADITNIRTEVGDMAEEQGRAIEKLSDIQTMLGNVGNPALDKPPTGIVGMLVNMGNEIAHMHHRLDDAMPRLDRLEDKEEVTQTQGRNEIIARMHEEKQRAEALIAEKKRVEERHAEDMAALQAKIDKMREDEQSRLRQMVYTLAKIVIPLAAGAGLAKWESIAGLFH